MLAIEEAHVSRRIQSLLKDENNQLKVDDAAKIIGCWKALSKQGLTNDLTGDNAAMQRAVAFYQVIEISKGAKTHKVSSKQIAGMFQKVVAAYQEEETEQNASLTCEAEHDTMQNPRYPLELFQRVITVSLETMKIVGSLPGLEI